MRVSDRGGRAPARPACPSRSDCFPLRTSSHERGGRIFFMPSKLLLGICLALLGTLFSPGAGWTTNAANFTAIAGHTSRFSQPGGCTLSVPDDPLSARGLATPYVLAGPCHESDPNTAAFVQAVILDRATGAVSLYDPLVV